MNPLKVQPSISIQWEWNNSRGIIRGKQERISLHGKEVLKLQEDHIDEILAVGRIQRTARPIEGPGEMRKHVWTLGHHLEHMLPAHGNPPCFAAVGNGNATCNPWFWTWIRGRLCRHASENAHLPSRRYSALLVRNPGESPRVSIETVRLAEEGNMCRIFSEPNGAELTAFVESATFGQQIVSNGQPVTQQTLKSMMLAGLFYDLRHPFLFARYPLGKDDTGKDRWLDVGLQPLWSPDGTLNLPMLEAACDGHPVPVDISCFDRALVIHALEEKGYAPGEYRILGDTLELRLRPGIYPHNIIGVRRDGTVLSVTMRGLSNRVGVTLLQAAELMARLGAEQALILDQGNDVFLNYSGQFILGAEEGLKKRLRSILLFRPDTNSLLPDDFRLVLYPRQ